MRQLTEWEIEFLRGMVRLINMNRALTYRQLAKARELIYESPDDLNKAWALKTWIDAYNRATRRERALTRQLKAAKRLLRVRTCNEEPLL